MRRLLQPENRRAATQHRVIIAGSISPLTLPKEPGDTDDCLLTASEVMQLKLNADWEVLSACNTIAGDNSGAEALSGLARAFFYAGARALLGRTGRWIPMRRPGSRPLHSTLCTRLMSATGQQRR
jgi:CHAT domain